MGRTRSWSVPVAVTVCLFVGSCGHGSASSGQASTSVTATSAATKPTSADALRAYLASQPHVVVESAPADVGGSLVAVAGVQRGPHDHSIWVVGFDGASWRKAADLVLPEPSYDFAPDLPVEISDVTQDGRADFLVRVMAGDTEPGVVVSDDGGRWRLVPMAGDAYDTYTSDVYAARDPVFSAGRLVTKHNDCIPDCADGHISDVAWRYSRASGHFAPG